MGTVYKLCVGSSLGVVRLVDRDGLACEVHRQDTLKHQALVVSDDPSHW